jgi:hypothetical protein
VPMLRYFHELSMGQREVARSIHRDRTPQAHCYVVDLAGQILQAYELKPLFATGHVAAGDQVRTQLAIAGRTESEFAVRHAIGDWSEMSPDEQARNVLAIELGGSVLSRFALHARSECVRGNGRAAQRDHTPCGQRTAQRQRLTHAHPNVRSRYVQRSTNLRSSVC